MSDGRGGRRVGTVSQPCTPGEKDRITIQIDRSILARVDARAREAGISRSAYLVSLIPQESAF